MVKINVTPIESASNNIVYASPITKIWTPIFPILCSIFGITALFTGYIIAVLNDHVDKWLPLISDGGAIPPESCVFGLLLNICVFFWILTCFCIHIQVLQHIMYHDRFHTKHKNVLYVMLFFAILSGIGIALVANFPLSTVRPVHSYGAMVGFLSGVIYAWCYITLVKILKPKVIPKKLLIFRLLLIIFVSIVVVLHEICLHTTFLVKRTPDGHVPPVPFWPKSTNILRLDPESPYYTNFIVGRICEWSLAVGYFIVVGSLSYELNYFEIKTFSSAQTINIQIK
ncbi:unnamed protein product [Bursaphelenchus okinawaensis]|uniref:CWH43-like N-terminal domain-containing protein n=1 Tax=Bursaphelenchus okinawaensis TaxID=465554 RepID=A0A811KG30_9BILA|nr:unnamed protein product [Bursaphelenchus okinawaensis]CAG9102186.1 unnamed protein product [Bursaphelenchus okinawaensis]